MKKICNKAVPRVMSIAGSDSGGGAGIQADLKTCSALGVYATTVITALTAQNTVAVKGIFAVDPSFVTAQIDAIMEDIGTDSAKTGMLDRKEIIQAVAEAVKRWKIEKFIVDPVMVAKSGDLLLKPDAVEALIKELFPLSYAITPNAPEAQAILSGMVIKSLSDMKDAAEQLHRLGPGYVVLKGGHVESEKVVDVLYDGKNFKIFEADRIPSRNTHGTGCTFSAALAAFLAKGEEIEDAVAKAKRYVTDAIKAGLPIGSGHGPLNHFYNCRTGEVY
ncbi:MAG: bifunctional hydroxymethylpyrimidine kinase/phosphomethylpyrimidine kinase [Thermodesulforhabdaceae bacterium]